MSALKHWLPIILNQCWQKAFMLLNMDPALIIKNTKTNKLFHWSIHFMYKRWDQTYEGVVWLVAMDQHVANLLLAKMDIQAEE